MNDVLSDLQYEYEERAAIIEYEAGHGRLVAERLAYLEVFGEDEF